MVKHLHLYDDKIEAARNAEKAGDLGKAEKAYLGLVDEMPAEFEAYNRLMVIYRKQKAYRKELSIVNKAIKAFESKQKEHQKTWMKENRVAAKLSKSLAVKLGVLNKNGLPVNKDPVVERWLKRKAVINKRLKKAE